MATSRRYPIGCALSLILGGFACQALAEPPTAAASNDTGLMTFPNVRVVDAPLAAAEQKPAAASPGVKAYRDPVSGEFREATAGEAQQLATAAARTRTGIATAKSGATAANTQAGGQITYYPDNSVGIELDDEFMVFQVAHKDAAGKLTRQCVTGEDSKAHALHSSATPINAQPEESHNDR
jgi:hypothetical protein